MDGLFSDLAQRMQEDPAAANVQAAVGELYSFFNQNTGHHYSPAAFAGLGQMYVDDPRFTKTIDKYAEGLSAFLAKAMAIYAENS